MRQKVALIRTLAFDPEILLLDEPFSALDYQTRLLISEEVYGIIRKENKTALLVTHDIAEAISMSDRVIVLTPRPAKVKKEYKIGMSDTPLARRSKPQFQEFFNSIWKELHNDESERS
jgi:NitT/TauT family transport system ATP-binding protein